MKKEAVTKGNYSRVVVTETIPLDTPIIFSNIWFYHHLRDLELDRNLDKFSSHITQSLFISNRIESYSIPMKYKIKKSIGEYRNLAVVHPAEQVKFIELYKIFPNKILHYCSKSTFSIRRPERVASTIYIKNAYDNAKKFKSGSPQKSTEDSKFKHFTSFFNYDGYTKLSQFFDDSEFHRLETQYRHFITLDVSKCFENIYTHSIEWATKSKEYSKQTTGDKDSFGAVFDKLMQTTNYNETSGILIGNEVSRIFSEVIFQNIDFTIKKNLQTIDLIEGADYEVKRYVDDFFIFTTDKSTSDKVISEIIKQLSFYRLHINESKTKWTERPFITNASSAKPTTSDALEELFDILFFKSSDEKTIQIKTNKIRRKHYLISKFINKVKSSCYEKNSAYSVMSGYIIGAILKRVINLSENNEHIIDEKISSYKDVSNILLDVTFHFFNITPSSANSVKVSMICYILYGMFNDRIESEVDTIKLNINLHIKNFLNSASCKELTTDKSYFSIELANLMFIARNMGDNYLLHPKSVKEIFNLDSLDSKQKRIQDKEYCSDYFRVMSTLYYIGNNDEYNDIKDIIIKYINKNLPSEDNFKISSKLFMLFLDSLSCPYIDIKQREVWAGKLFSFLSKKSKRISSDKNSMISHMVNNQWFISWKHPDLWNTLVNKELMLNY